MSRYKESIGFLLLLINPLLDTALSYWIFFIKVYIVFDLWENFFIHICNYSN